MAHRIADRIIDDLSHPGPRTPLGTAWELVSDQVMGGVSDGQLTHEPIAGRPARHLTGTVSLDNNGGFLQMALDLRPDRDAVDASGFAGLELDLYGNGQSYNIHLRTDDVTRPWQSYRQTVTASPDWTTHHLPFTAFTAHRLDAPFDPCTLRRIGIVAIGRAFHADIALGGLRFYD